MFRRLAITEKTVRLIMPLEFECKNSNDEYASVDLADWFCQQAVELAEQFDARNGNDFYSQLIVRLESIALLK